MVGGALDGSWFDGGGGAGDVVGVGGEVLGEIAGVGRSGWLVVRWRWRGGIGFSWG